jgi:hypothetical protein
MTTRETKRLHVELLNSYKVPRHLDARSKAIRDDGRWMIMTSDLLDRPDFGWHFATTSLVRGYASPLLAEHPYRWIVQAVRLFGIQSGWGDSVEGDRTRLSAIANAHEMYQNPTPSRLHLHAALLSRGATAATVARALGLDAMTVDAYDAVFFNVMDRKDSPAYLRHAVKRGVTRERGMEPPDNAEEESLLMIGLNGTLEDVLRLSGSDACTWAA